MDDLKGSVSSVGKSLLPTYLRELMEILSNPTGNDDTLRIATDFSSENSIAAAMLVGIGPDGNPTYKMVDMYDEIQGHKPDLIIIDEFGPFYDLKTYDCMGFPKPGYLRVPSYYEEPIKQNGKSGAYLKHDRSKGCRGRRQWNRKIR